MVLVVQLKLNYLRKNIFQTKPVVDRSENSSVTKAVNTSYLTQMTHVYYKVQNVKETNGINKVNIFL
jgi:hypothetical protein